MTVHTGTLAVALVPVGAGDVLVYTPAPGEHARLWCIDLQTFGAAGAVALYLLRPSTGVPATLNVTPGAVVPEFIHDPLPRGLELGDEVRVVVPAGTGAAVWLSGTRYSP